MKVAVIGGGGREHALVKSLLASKVVQKVYSIPGSDGINLDAQCLKIDLINHMGILEALKSYAIELVIIGPEANIVDGLGDYLRKNGIKVVAPSREASRLEASKDYAKDFMYRHNVPTAQHKRVTSYEEVIERSKDFRAPFVLKVDSLAAGKGVFICQSKSELEIAAKKIFYEKAFGQTFAILEEFLSGWELSYLVLTNGESYTPLCLAQDHKQLLDGDTGPNTGGMGVVAPLIIGDELRFEIESKIVKPTVEGLKKDNLHYRGVLYFGIMVTSHGPKVLEYNVRFGDPEAQVILPLLDGDWGEVFDQLSQGNISSLKWIPKHAACVVLAAPGYPDNPVKGLLIEGHVDRKLEDAYFIHAGTKLNKFNEWETSGGRVLNAIGLGVSKKAALKNAYELTYQVKWNNMIFRKDIGKRENQL